MKTQEWKREKQPIEGKGESLWKAGTREGKNMGSGWGISKAEGWKGENIGEQRVKGRIMGR